MLVVGRETRPWQSLLIDQSWLAAASFGGKSNFRQAFHQQNIVSAFLLGFGLILDSLRWCKEVGYMQL